MKNQLKKMGVGVSYRPHFFEQIINSSNEIDFIEIIAENFFDKTYHHELLELRRHFPMVVHSVSLSLGSVDGISKRILEKLLGLVELIKPEWISEHISYTQTQQHELGHIVPVTFSNESLDVFQKNIDCVTSNLNVPLILENIAYPFRAPGSVLSESEFVSQLLAKNNCGMLLDVTNLYANALNHYYNPLEYINSLPSEKIVQIHFTGGQWISGEYVDTHSHDTPEDVWYLLSRILQKHEPNGIILERDDVIPLQSLLGEIGRARQMAREAIGNPV